MNSTFKNPFQLIDKTPGLLRLVVAVSFYNVLFFVFLRLIFWVAFSNPDDTIPTTTLLTSFWIGLKFDVRLALFMAMPLFLIGWIRWLSPFQGPLRNITWLGWFLLAQLVVLFGYIADFGYYAYLQNRLDATSTRFLQDPLISAQMVWETYPVIWITLAYTLVIIAYGIGLKKIFGFITSQNLPSLRKRHKLWIVPVSLVLFIFGLFGKFSFYPLRWSDAFFSTHHFASAVALNPVLYFFDTLKNKDSGFDINKAKTHYPAMAHYLGINDKDRELLDYRRHIQSHQPISGQPNVVVVILESFASFKVGAFGNALNPTPHFDSIARNGIFFRRFYTPHTGTARSVFAAITGIPDIELNKTSSRNPLIVKQHTIVNDFKGYEKFYFLGGSANWGNIRGILSGNIPGLKIYEEGSYSDDSPRVDVWGISDLHLFKEAHKVFRKQNDRPFFAIIQTSGNHRPYTIPADNDGFKRDKQSDAMLKKYGFNSDGEFNSFRFMDHSIGKFLEYARKEKYFDNTVFAFFGDHGLGGQGEHIPAYIKQLNLHHFHVPFVIYAPGLIKKPVIHDKVASEVDVLPSLASLIIPEYTNTTFGRDLLNPRYDEQRYAFTINHTRIPEIGVVSENYYFQMYADGNNRRLHRLDKANPRDNVLDQYPEIARKMQGITLGLYETAQYVRFNNPP